jgi:hypothetical protein
MTTRIHSQGWIQINSPQRWIGGDVNNPAAGMVRWDQNSQCLKIYTGSTWVDYVQDYELSVDSDFEMIVKWVKSKIQEELKLKEKIAQHPALDDAYNKFKTLEALVTDVHNQ